jgi:hypothetical protein
MKVIFLDVDGVLINDIFDGISIEAVDVLASVLQITDASIVVSSSLKSDIGPDSNFIKDLFSASEESAKIIYKAIVGITPTFSCSFDNIVVDDINYVGRSGEIMSWIENNECDNWVAIDDLSLNLPTNHFVKTNARIGLTSDVGEELIEKLR